MPCSQRSKAFIISRRWAPAPRRTATCQGVRPRRVKKTVNFDAEVYHLYYSDDIGTPGSVMTYFPFPMSPRHVRVPNWERPLSPSPKTRLATGKKDSPLTVWPDFRSSNSGTRSAFASGFPDGDAFSLVAVDGVRAPVRQHRGRPGQGDHGLPPDKSASKGCRCNARANQLHGLPGGGSQRRLVELRHQRRQRRRRHRSGNSPQGRSRRLGAGSVHHIAFAVDDRAAQLEVRKA